MILDILLLAGSLRCISHFSRLSAKAFHSALSRDSCPRRNENDNNSHPREATTSCCLRSLRPFSRSLLTTSIVGNDSTRLASLEHATDKKKYQTFGNLSQVTKYCRGFEYLPCKGCVCLKCRSRLVNKHHEERKGCGLAPVWKLHELSAEAAYAPTKVASSHFTFDELRRAPVLLYSPSLVGACSISKRYLLESSRGSSCL